MSGEWSDGWETRRTCELSQAYHARRAHPLWPEAVIAAAARGFRPAHLWEILDPTRLDEKFLYRGEVFMRCECAVLAARTSEAKP